MKDVLKKFFANNYIQLLYMWDSFNPEKCRGGFLFLPREWFFLVRLSPFTPSFPSFGSRLRCPLSSFATWSDIFENLRIKKHYYLKKYPEIIIVYRRYHHATRCLNVFYHFTHQYCSPAFLVGWTVVLQWLSPQMLNVSEAPSVNFILTCPCPCVLLLHPVFQSPWIAHLKVEHPHETS